MNLIRSILGRREFLVAFMSSALSIIFGRAVKLFGPFFKTGVAKASEKSLTGEKKPLKGIVVYYSGTGNTARAANALWRGMKSVIPCDVAPIKKVNPKDMAKYDVMAIGGPNWYMRVPANISIFTHDMPRMDGKHCILFGTHGSTPVAQFWFMSRNILKKGMTIIGWNDWYGEGRQTPHARVPDSEYGHPDEIDLMEAEAFGRLMAENSVRIYAGERTLIPEIPTPSGGGSSQWSPRINTLGNITFASPPPDSTPEFDFTKCVYPRCTQCIENCPVHAIDFSVITLGVSVDSPLVLKEACSHCGGLCQTVCLYDAIAYEGEKTIQEIDMKRCTYPKCTLCVDECPQDAIDFSKSQPVFHNYCEGAGLCWNICPEDAIEILNMAQIHLKQAWWFRSSGEGARVQAQMPTTGEGGEAAQATRQTTRSLPSRFRPLIREEEIGARGQRMFLPNAPRLVLNKEDWPYHIDEG